MFILLRFISRIVGAALRIQKKKMISLRIPNERPLTDVVKMSFIGDNRRCFDLNSTKAVTGCLQNYIRVFESPPNAVVLFNVRKLKFMSRKILNLTGLPRFRCS